MSNSIAPGSSADVNVKVTALTTNPNVPVQYKTVILKKNLVNGVNTLTQEMMSATNTKYVVKYDYALGENITFPANCVLEFDGGSISGSYTITGQNTGINAGFVKILGANVTLAGTFNVAEAYPEWFGAKGDGETDDIASITKTCNSFKNCFFTRGKTYGVTNYFSISDSIIHGEGTIKALGTIPDTGNTHRQILLSSSNNVIKDITIDGNSQTCGGIASYNASNIRISNVKVINVTSMAFNIANACYNVDITNCYVNRADHGIQLWFTDHVTINNCTVIDVNGGGIWGAAPQNTLITGCYVERCGDVGIDIEGGVNNSVIGNHVKNCVNGELAIFSGNEEAASIGMKNIIFSDNTAIRDSSTVDIGGNQNTIVKGNIFVASMRSDAENIVFKNNTLKSSVGGCIYCNDIDNTAHSYDQLVFDSNRLDGYGGNRIACVYGLKFINNYVNCMTTYFRNCGNSQIENNIFNKVPNLDDTNYAIFLFTHTEAFSGQGAGVHLINNKIYGGEKCIVCQMDIYNEGYYNIENNYINGYPTVSGGLKQVLSGTQRKAVNFKEQTFFIKVNSDNFTVTEDIMNIDCLNYNSYVVYGEGYLFVNYGGFDRNLYRVSLWNGTIISHDGTGADSGLGSRASGILNSISVHTLNLTYGSDSNLILKVSTHMRS